MKLGSVTVEIQYPAGMTAANSINVKQRKLVDFIASGRSTFTHCNFSQIFGSKLRGNNRRKLGRRANFKSPS